MATHISTVRTKLISRCLERAFEKIQHAFLYQTCAKDIPQKKNKNCSYLDTCHLELCE